jgi:Ca2+-binding EF-hand superfamily protein
MSLSQMTIVPALLLSGLAFAQLPGDSDEDGRLSLSEFQQQSAQRFARLDEDGDGYLTSEEMRAGRADFRGRRGPGAPDGRAFERADADDDGVVSLAEAQSVWPSLDAERFAAIDADGNGLLTAQELRGGRRALFSNADADGDGALSLAELQAVRPGMTAEAFARFDTDNDGLIGPDERRARRGPRF